MHTMSTANALMKTFAARTRPKANTDTWYQTASGPGGAGPRGSKEGGYGESTNTSRSWTHRTRWCAVRLLALRWGQRS